MVGLFVVFNLNVFVICNEICLMLFVLGIWVNLFNDFVLFVFVGGVLLFELFLFWFDELFCVLLLGLVLLGFWLLELFDELRRFDRFWLFFVLELLFFELLFEEEVLFVLVWLLFVWFGLDFLLIWLLELVFMFCFWLFVFFFGLFDWLLWLFCWFVEFDCFWLEFFELGLLFFGMWLLLVLESVVWLFEFGLGWVIW